MYGSVPTTPKSIEDYRSIVGEKVIDEIAALAAPLRGAKVLHLGVRAFGTGVAEILGSLVPLMEDVGLKAEWQIVRSTAEFESVSKAMYQALGGSFVPWSPDMENTWLSYGNLNARLFDEDFDFVVVHDPQAAAILHEIVRVEGGRPAGKWAWHCHLDLTEVQTELWDLLRPFIDEFDAVAFASQEWVKHDLAVTKLVVIPPAIDPLDSKNMEVSQATIDNVLEQYSLDVTRPIICQVSRFDQYSDPLGVIEAYRLAKERIPQLQLVLVASMISDDPQSWSYYERCARSAGLDYDIHLLSQLNNIGNTEINAFQRASNVVIQKSIRKGFGLGIAEALWKARPVVAGRVGGFPLQVKDGVTGYLVSTVEECSDRVVYLLQHPDVARKMGQNGREYIREKRLITRFLKDYLELFNSLRCAG
ncbi:MAG: glycosyltransferase [Chloroflexi bacterium]|nr:glycosyltransferase [Chloroflexota bacterium]